MTAHRFLDAATVGGTRRTDDGYLVGTVRCARTGMQAYTRGELKLDGNPAAPVIVYRPEAAVFDRASLQTYAGKPITVGHPKVPVDAKNWKDLAVGTVGSKVARDGDFVMVDFAIMDAESIQQVEDGTCEVSMGYSTPMRIEDGVAPDGTAYQAIQTGPIRINHFAVVDRARGGKELRLHLGDAVEPNWGAAPINDQKETPMGTKTVVLGDAAVVLPLADAAAVEAFKTSMTKQLADAATEFDKMKSEKDEELGKLKVKNKQLEDAQVTPAVLSKMIADRVALEQQVKVLDAAIVCDGVNDSDLRKLAVVSALGDAVVADATPAMVDGMFKALVHARDSAADDTVRDAFRTQKRRVADSGGSASLWTDAVAKAAGVSFKKDK